MKRLFVLLFILFLSSYAFSEEQLKTAETKIGVIDLQRALNESEAGKKAKAELEALIKEKQAIINERQNAIEKSKEDLAKKALVLSESVRKQKSNEIANMEKNLETLIADSEAEIQKTQRDRELAILKELEGIIEQFGIEDKYTVILPADVTIYSLQTIDLTGAVIKKYNELKATPEKKTGK